MHSSPILSKDVPRKLTDPNPEPKGCNRAPIKSIQWFHQLLIKETPHASNVALLSHVGMSRVCEPPEASFATMSFHLSANCVRNEIGRLMSAIHYRKRRRWRMLVVFTHLTGDREKTWHQRLRFTQAKGRGQRFPLSSVNVSFGPHQAPIKQDHTHLANGGGFDP